MSRRLMMERGHVCDCTLSGTGMISGWPFLKGSRLYSTQRRKSLNTSWTSRGASFLPSWFPWRRKRLNKYCFWWEFRKLLIAAPGIIFTYLSWVLVYMLYNTVDHWLCDMVSNTGGPRLVWGKAPPVLWPHLAGHPKQAEQVGSHFKAVLGSIGHPTLLFDFLLSQKV